ncbi:3-hydroxyacyl-CoA dehydrogenase family protein [Bacteroidota bacterium]
MNDIRKVGIIGSGKMGFDIFNYISEFNFKLIWYTRNVEHKEALKNTYRKKIKRQLKHGIISQEIFDLKNGYQITIDLNDLSDCDLVIESVIEERDVKTELFKKLDVIAKPSCVLVSNSSSILPSELCENVQRRNRVLGLHFFYPIAFKNVVEIISSEYTDEISAEKMRLFLDDIKRFYIEQEETEAFILNRILLQLQVITFNIVKEKGINFKQLDEIAKEVIPDFGLFEMMDNVGHNTMYNAILNYSRMDEDKRKYNPLLDELKKRYPNSDETEHLSFYESELKEGIITEDLSTEIKERLQSTVNELLDKYSKKYNINIFNLKKGLEEYCGIMF